MRMRGAIAVAGTVALLLLVAPVTGTAALILETGPLGTTGGGTSLLTTQFLGARFSLEERTLITSIGGHVKSSYEYEDRSLFVALVPLTATDLLPSDVTLSDAIFSTVFLAPEYDPNDPYPHQVPETTFSLSVVLGPGDYAVVFGSGLFGATGAGWMPVSGSTVSTPWYFIYNQYVSSDFYNLPREQLTRFVVRGEVFQAPEPGTLALLGVGVAALATARRRRK